MMRPPRIPTALTQLLAASTVYTAPPRSTRSAAGGVLFTEEIGPRLHDETSRTADIVEAFRQRAWRFLVRGGAFMEARDCRARRPYGCGTRPARRTGNPRRRSPPL